MRADAAPIPNVLFSGCSLCARPGRSLRLAPCRRRFADLSPAVGP
ncbi:hypothetical protein HMPREF0972_01768 [Actinomyces sp. oral taxon 848 str. F0332]|nr:hypothetical protein HMPREF0972_01768 [Actinomyces sp. oral taxon 848 str. F0332]